MGPPGDNVLRHRGQNGPMQPGQRSPERGASARGWRSGTGPGTGPAAAGLPARGESWVLLSHPTSAETARGCPPEERAGCCSLTRRQLRLHGAARQRRELGVALSPDVS